MLSDRHGEQPLFGILVVDETVVVERVVVVDDNGVVVGFSGLCEYVELIVVLVTSVTSIDSL